MACRRSWGTHRKNIEVRLQVTNLGPSSGHFPLLLEQGREPFHRKALGVHIYGMLGDADCSWSYTTLMSLAGPWFHSSLVLSSSDPVILHGGNFCGNHGPYAKAAFSFHKSYRHVSDGYGPLLQNLKISQRGNIFFQNAPFKYILHHVVKTESRYIVYSSDTGGKVTGIYTILYFFLCTLYRREPCWGFSLSMLVNPFNFLFGLVITWLAQQVLPCTTQPFHSSQCQKCIYSCVHPIDLMNFYLFNIF